MSEYPYKKRVVAGDVPEINPYDYTRQLDSIARDMGNLSEQTAKIAQQNFLNSFELESRKAMAESYERNMNNPAQLEEEQNKIKTKFVSALPTKEMREQAKAQFDIHAMGYLGKAKENLYNQQFKELQASTFDRTNTVLNDIQGLGKDLYNPNLGISGTAANSIGMDIVSLEQMITQKDERGNRVVSPEREASFRAEIRKRLTASDLDHFDGLNTLADKEKFYKAYKDKKTKKIWLDPEDERGYSEQGMTENNTDWTVYQKNLDIMGRELEYMKQANERGDVSKMPQEEKDAFDTISSQQKIQLDLAFDGIVQEDGEVDPLSVLAYLNNVDDLANDPARRVMGLPVLSQKDRYNRNKAVIDKGYWKETVEALSADKGKTNFGSAVKGINWWFEQNAGDKVFNAYDRMEIMRELYREMARSLPNGLRDRVSVMNNDLIKESVENAAHSFVIKSDKFSEQEKNRILSTPPEIKTTVIPENFGEKMLKVRY